MGQGGSWLCVQVLLSRIGQIRYGLTVDEQLGGEAQVPLVEVGIVHDG